MIHITIVAPDDDDPFFYEWLRNKEWKDGTFISSTDGNKPSVKTMNFENARCYRIQEFFSPLNPVDTQMLTEIAIHARNVIFGRKENSKFVPLTIGTSEDTLAYDDSEEYTKTADLANGNTPKIKKLEPKIKTKPPFNKKAGKNGNFDEFDKQLGDQQNAINKMTVREWLDNRDHFKNENKADYNKKAKQAREAYREKIRNDEYTQYREQGLSKKAASAKADEFMKGKDALHNPDGIAGGTAEGVSRMGDREVNRSIGSQWRGKGRADSLEQQVREQLSKQGIKTPPNDNIPENLLMNINLI